MRFPDMTLARRWLLLWALFFWQGGFLFYSSVVVPVGGSVLGSEREQGFITRQVTNYLNLAGAVALAVWAWDLAAGRGGSPVGRRLRWAIWVGLVLSLVVLVWLHPRLDELLKPEDAVILNRRAFRALHERYLIVSTVQWVGCLALSAWMIRTWRAEDASGRWGRAIPRDDPVDPDAQSDPHRVADQIAPQEAVAEDQGARGGGAHGVDPGGVIELAQLDGERERQGRQGEPNRR